MGTKTCIGIGTALSVMFREACVRVNVTRRSVLEFALGRLGGTKDHLS